MAWSEAVLRILRILLSLWALASVFGVPVVVIAAAEQLLGVIANLVTVNLVTANLAA